MNTADTDWARLIQALNISQREIEHLSYSWRQLFIDRTPDLDWVKALSEQPNEGVVLEAFVSRFARLQDQLGARVIPRWLAVLAEEPGSHLENLNRAEKLGVLSSAEDWLTIRQIRNQLVHEYMRRPEDLVQALQTARTATGLFIDTYNRIRAYTIKAFSEKQHELPPEAKEPL